MKAIVGLKRLTVTVFTVLLSVSAIQAQEESSTSFDVGGDIVSNYVWRGTAFAGPSVQPWVEFSAGNFTIGSWGSFARGFSEADIYLSYGFDFGLSLGLTDYYYPGTDYFTFLDTTNGTHGFEINVGYEVGGLSISGNYMLNQAPVAGTAGGDLYFELGYGFDMFSVFVGGGNGWHTADGDFMVCNVGLSVSKEVEITEKFSLPLSGSVIWNPDKEQFFVVGGISF